MGKYAQDAKELLTYIGGKENIAAVSHCMTRMRFVLNDPGKADIKKIEAMKVVKGSFTQSGQFQVIIGNTVADFYNDFVAAAGVEGVSKDAVKQAAKKNQNILQRIVTAIAEIFAPLIPAIITGGLILGFRNCIGDMEIFENGTKTLADLSQFWKGIYDFLWLIGEAVFHVGIPVGICWSVTKKMGTTQMLGIILGLTLISGQLTNAYDIGKEGTVIGVWDFGLFEINKIGYQSQVIPAILAAFTLVYLEKFFRKITPQVVSMIVVPFCSLVLTVIVAHFVLGPIGWQIGSVISDVVYAGITGPVRVLFGALFGCLYAPLVITGLHHMTNAVDLQLIADFEGTMLWPMIALSNIAQGSAVLGMIYLQRKDAAAQEVNVPSCVSCYLGVTEPAIFGVNLKYMFPFVCGMIGSTLAGIVCTATSTTANAIGVGGIPGILSIQTQYIPSFALCMVIAAGVSFLLTVLVGKKKKFGAVPAGAAAKAASGTAQTERAEAPGNARMEASAQPAGQAGARQLSGAQSAAADTAGDTAAGTAKDTAAGAAGGAASGTAKDTAAGAAKDTAANAAAGKAADGGTGFDNRLTAVLDGRMIPLSEVGDGVFSEGIMGDGLAIVPENEVVQAPAEATVTVLMEESRHACGLTFDNGMELLIHVGIDTVDMKGDGFAYLVQEGQRVHRGTPLIRFDREKIRAAGHPDTTVCVITEEGEAKNIRIAAGGSCRSGETEMISCE